MTVSSEQKTVSSRNNRGETMIRRINRSIDSQRGAEGIGDQMNFGYFDTTQDRF